MQLCLIIKGLFPFWLKKKQEHVLLFSLFLLTYIEGRGSTVAIIVPPFTQYHEHSQSNLAN